MEIIESHKAFDGDVEVIQHPSRATGTTMTFSVYRPSEKPRGCLLWLSGLTCTHENFITKAAALAHLKQHNLMLICPDTSPRGLDLSGEHDSWDFGSGAGFYVNATLAPYADNYRMWDYINDELYALITERYDMQNKVSLFGHSMGGHGALTIGLTQPEKYQSLSAFAPICHPSITPWGQKALAGYLGEDESRWQQHDAVALIKAGYRHPQPILVSQGGSDPFLEAELMPDALQSACDESGQALQLTVHDGYDHSYYFISTFIEEHITFHSEWLV